ncbi:G1/S-specific cyclin CCN1 [Fusarium oxysporum f. sp. rapae]|uniref:G1/S-specific cyclin CCN1 n=1 Tax=Fusarium oxysporum f. sp. rapae TaxID=485398 RepID=A0A8J5NLM4_FUSOX|nr:G1/S-specific cyclin CCN1 [Fusarium oxysporum f. sp. rapae]
MAYSQQGDSYFVESDEPHHRIMAREAARMIARQRQDIIGVELSRLVGYEYLEDIMQHMRQMEDETLPDVSLIDMQKDIQWPMRPYLIDFLIEAHAAFGLLPETLFLTVNLLDRYCSKRVVYKQHYQLVGCAALLIAAKYCDTKDRVPQIHELNNMCCGLYEAGMFTEMEMHVVDTLYWTIGPTTVDFSQLMVAEEGDEQEVAHVATYLCEIALYYRDFVSTKPSVMARSSLSLARAILGRTEIYNRGWDETENFTLSTLACYLHQPSPTLARKYSTTGFSRVLQKLAAFVAEQAEIARRAANPATPLAKPINKHTTNIFKAPQKGHSAMEFDGYSTPPITSDSNSLMSNHNMAKESYGLPPQRWVTSIPPNHAAVCGPSQYVGCSNQHGMNQ